MTPETDDKLSAPLSQTEFQALLSEKMRAAVGKPKRPAVEVKLDVYDVSGRRVTTLVDERLGAGEHRVEWDGMGAKGDRVASGVYWVSLRSDGLRETRRVTLVR